MCNDDPHLHLLSNRNTPLSFYVELSVPAWFNWFIFQIGYLTPISSLFFLPYRISFSFFFLNFYLLKHSVGFVLRTLTKTIISWNISNFSKTKQRCIKTRYWHAYKIKSVCNGDTNIQLFSNKTKKMCVFFVGFILSMTPTSRLIHFWGWTVILNRYYWWPLLTITLSISSVLLQNIQENRINLMVFFLLFWWDLAMVVSCNLNINFKYSARIHYV